jgi:hypothetical protein
MSTETTALPIGPPAAVLPAAATAMPADRFTPYPQAPSNVPTNDADSGQADRKEGRTRTVLIALLVVATAAVVITAFALSFYGLNDFARRVMKLPTVLAAFVPIGLDIFSLCGILATYLLRHTEWRVRAYTWTVFLVPAGLSIAGNLVHAQHRHLGQPGVVAAALIPVILALATHLVVVVQRHSGPGTEASTEEHVCPVPAADEDEQVTDPDEYPEDAPVSGGPTGNAEGGESAAKARALAVLLDGGDVPAAAEAAGVDPSTVRRWVRRLQERPPTRTPKRRTAPARDRSASAESGTDPTSDLDGANA